MGRGMGGALLRYRGGSNSHAWGKAILNADGMPHKRSLLDHQQTTLLVKATALYLDGPTSTYAVATLSQT